jgi:hydrogenase expression/formation protein HypC
MCLGVPGSIVSIEQNPDGLLMGRVDFSGIVKEVCLAYVPEAGLGDYVIVHAGFALQVLDPDEAMQSLALLWELAEASAAEAAGRTI